MLSAKAVRLTTQNKKGMVVMNEKINRVITALEKNNMQGIYVPCINSIKETVEYLIFARDEFLNSMSSVTSFITFIKSGNETFSSSKKALFP